MRSLVRLAQSLTFFAVCAGTLVSGQEPLTLREAIQIGLAESQDVKSATASKLEAKASASLARVQFLPQLSFTEDTSRGNDPVYVFGAKLRQQRFTQADFALPSLNRPVPLGNFTTRLSGSWTPFDSFRTQKMIRSADLMYRSAETSVDAANQKVVLEVVRAYQSVLYAERRIAIAEHEQETADALLRSADDHVGAGLALASDQMSAQVNVAERKQELIEAQGELEIAWAQLGVAMGRPDFPRSPLKPIESHNFPDGALNEEVESALKTRQDLKALIESRSAQDAALSAVKAGLGPRVSAYGNWEQDRPTFAGAGGESWVAGVQIGLDILPFSKHAAVAKEKAIKERMDAQIGSYELQVRLQVTQRHIQRQVAEQSLETARAAIGQSAESLRILRNRYEAGLATITDLLRAEDAERQSQSNYWHAVYGNAVAYAELLFATGKLTPTAAEDLQ